MSLEHEKLIAFENAIVSQTNMEVAAIEKELLDLETAELEAAKNAEYNELFVTMQQQVQELKAKYKKQVTKAKLTSKQDLLRYRNQMVDELFCKARGDILAFANSVDYAAFFTQKLQIALDEMVGDQLTVTVREADVALGQSLLTSFDRIHAVECDPQNTLGGFCLLNTTQGLMIDHRLQTALEDKRPQFQATCGLSVQF